ncbi:MAG TPA: MerR family transcriptional regulator [Pseudonocardia sp.]|nr:MerR family transcriptional regulator [Pseudonocardia sp.]
MREGHGQVGIGEAAATFGLAVSTLPYWEQRGQISPAGRRGTWRRYGADEMHRIGLIQLWRDAGMLSLERSPPCSRALIGSTTGAPRWRVGSWRSASSGAGWLPPWTTWSTC